MQHTRKLQEAIVINAGPSRIWAVLTKPEYTRQYFYDYAVYSSWATGDDIRWESEKDGQHFIVKKGKVKNIIPGIFIDFNIWDVLEEDPENAGTSTVYEMQTIGNGIQLTVTQVISDCPEQEFKYQQQNWRSMLQKIKWLAEYS